MAAPPKGPLAGNVNMMPMIDILLQLVIFFLVATQITTAERSLPIVLPQASAAKPLTSKPKEFFIDIDRQGHYYAHGAPATLDSLEKQLGQASVDNPQRQSVVIRADKNCVWNHVVAVMNSCNKVGIADYRVTTSEAAN
ncbi:MAG TPA: biopolymer transporter ExbD [Pirellulales bacterium]|jgi:biopolymer transport protein ExbD|nr:biopolymer transporter ExbD [Pirellulales bacterium]